MQNLIWVGAHVNIDNQPKGMPRQGTITSIKGGQAEVRRDLTRTQQQDDLIEDFGVYDVNDLRASAPTVNDVPWEDGWEPIIVEEPHREVGSIVTFSKYGRFAGVNNHKPFLAVPNAAVRMDGNIETVVAEHSFARDFEGSQSNVFVAGFSVLKFQRAYDGILSFVGTMDRLNFFEPAGDSPWKHAVKTAVYEETKGYPYMPPLARINKHELPLTVQVDLYTGTHDQLDRALNWMVGLEDHGDH